MGERHCIDRMGFSDAAIMRAKQEAALAKKQAEAAAGGSTVKK